MDEKKDTIHMTDMASGFEELNIDVDLSETRKLEEVNTENLMDSILGYKKNSKIKATNQSVIYDLGDIFSD